MTFHVELEGPGGGDHKPGRLGAGLADDLVKERRTGGRSARPPSVDARTREPPPFVPRGTVRCAKGFTAGPRGRWTEGGRRMVAGSDEPVAAPVRGYAVARPSTSMPCPPLRAHPRPHQGAGAFRRGQVRPADSHKGRSARGRPVLAPSEGSTGRAPVPRGTGRVDPISFWLGRRRVELEGSGGRPSDGMPESASPLLLFLLSSSRLGPRSTRTVLRLSRSCLRPKTTRMGPRGPVETCSLASGPCECVDEAALGECAQSLGTNFAREVGERLEPPSRSRAARLPNSADHDRTRRPARSCEHSS